VVVTGLDLRALGALAQAVATAPVTPTAVEIGAPDPRLLVRFETTASAADHQASHVARLAAARGAASTVLDGAAEADAWLAHETGTRQTAGTLLKLALLPTEVPTVLTLVEREAGPAIAWRAAGRATLGVLFVHLDGPAPAVAALVGALRRTARARDGHLAILTAPADVTAIAPRWDDLGPAAQLMRAVKAQFDPHGTLCPAVAPGGLS
jgi:glycolate oxidase FAD binding subunit